MTASSLKIVGTPTTYTISDLAAISQQIPVPATTTGNMLIALIASNETTAANNVTAVTDSASNTWTQRGSTQSSGTGAGHVATQIYATTGGATVSATWFKITPNANLKTVAVTFLEIAGATNTPVDVNNGGTATAATSITATNTPVTSGDLVFFFAAAGGQSLAHVPDDKADVARVGGPYSAGTAGAGIVTDLVMSIGAPAVALSTSFTAVGSSSFAWSTVSLKASVPGVGGLYTVIAGASPSAQDVNQFTNVLNGTTTSVPVVVSNRISAGLTGATAQNGYVGATSSGAPVTGSFLAGDWIVDQTGIVRICTASGSPGTWVSAGHTNYMARAFQGTPQNFTGSSSQFAVTMDTTSFDPKAMFGSGGFVIPFSGSRWRVIAGQHVSATAGNRVAVSLTVNGTEFARGYDGTIATGGVGGGIVSDIQSFSSGDIIRAALICTATGATVATTAQNYLCLMIADS